MRIHLSAAALALLALGACQQAKQEEQKAVAAPNQSAPEAKPGITLANARLVLPAVAGNPGAAYFQIDNSAGANVVVSAISIGGAEKTEVHQTTGDEMLKVDSVDIAPSTSLKFEPGALHVMVFNIAPRLKAGGSTELTITFADGDKASMPMKIEAAGGMGMEMGDMHHGDSH